MCRNFSRIIFNVKARMERENLLFPLRDADAKFHSRLSDSKGKVVVDGHDGRGIGLRLLHFKESAALPAPGASRASQSVDPCSTMA